MQTRWHDLRYSLRQLVNSPGFSLTAVASLAWALARPRCLQRHLRRVDESLPLPRGRSDRPAWSSGVRRTEFGGRPRKSPDENDQSEDCAKTISRLAGGPCGDNSPVPAIIIDGVAICQENLPVGRILESTLALRASMMRGTIHLPGG